MPTITARYQGDMLFETRLGNHTLRVDVPPGMGGRDRGPTPSELFVASLGTCVDAYVVEACDRFKVDSSEMKVEVSFDEVGQPPRLANLKIKIHLPFGDCQNREEKLRSIARHCPIHETLTTLQGARIELVGDREPAMEWVWL